MKTLEEIKNNYAKEQGFYDWADLYRNAGYYDEEKFFMYENKVFELVQIEQQKLIVENTDVTEIQSPSGCWYFGVDKSSIINENNIIK